MADCLYRSYVLWPVGHALPNADLATMMALAGIVDRVRRVALIVAGPVIGLLLLLDLAVALLERVSPQLKLNDLAPTLKTVVVAMFLLVYANALFHYVGEEVATVRHGADTLGLFLR